MHNSERSNPVDRSLDWLGSVQLATGELPSFASPLGDQTPDWQPDNLKFITALAALACNEIDDPRSVAVVDRAVHFLRAEREPSAMWRYWTRSSDQFDYTPPDADDTACSSMAVALRGDSTAENVRLLLSNRDPEGRFYTWIIPHGQSIGIKSLWALRDEFRRATQARRAELWANSEATPDDVDGVVNANVIRYLGPASAPPEAIDWVRHIIFSDNEHDCDSWHRNRFTMYASIADGHRRGIAAFGELGATIIDRIAGRLDAGGGVGPPLDTALALLAVQGFDGPRTLRRTLRRSLLDRQHDDGSWSRSAFYYGGPDEVFGWASGALSTAVSAQVLAAEDRCGT